MDIEKLNTLRMFMQNTYIDAKHVEPSIARNILSDIKYLDALIAEQANDVDTGNDKCDIQNVSVAKRTVCKCKWNKQTKIFSSATIICSKCGGVIAN